MGRAAYNMAGIAELFISSPAESNQHMFPIPTCTRHVRKGKKNAPHNQQTWDLLRTYSIHSLCRHRSPAVRSRQELPTKPDQPGHAPSLPFQSLAKPQMTIASTAARKISGRASSWGYRESQDPVIVLPALPPQKNERCYKSLPPVIRQYRGNSYLDLS